MGFSMGFFEGVVVWILHFAQTNNCIICEIKSWLGQMKDQKWVELVCQGLFFRGFSGCLDVYSTSVCRLVGFHNSGPGNVLIN